LAPAVNVAVISAIYSLPRSPTVNELSVAVNASSSLQPYVAPRNGTAYAPSCAWTVPGKDQSKE